MDYKHLVWLAAAAAALTLARLAVPDDAAPQGSLASAASVLGPAPAAGSGPKAEPDAQPPQPASPASAPSAAASTQPPYGLSPEQWQQLQQALADHPQRDAEMARIGAYMQYMGTAQRFRQLRQQAAGAAPGEELQALARTLESGMQEHLDRGELTAGEALLLRSATLEVLEPNSARRQQALALWQQGMASVQAARTPDVREAAFAQQQAALVAKWSAQPVAQRDPRALEAQLEALRQSLFNPPR